MAHPPLDCHWGVIPKAPSNLSIVTRHSLKLLFHPAVLGQRAADRGPEDAVHAPPPEAVAHAPPSPFGWSRAGL
ncbi:hypothetical protein C2E23DRAFT_835911 [Lenzites betulinus]|nr:hypothetical protein C2E23DRAFT_835911 [Lenzites betulinus]